jgi:hypothetical protein
VTVPRSPDSRTKAFVAMTFPEVQP